MLASSASASASIANTAKDKVRIYFELSVMNDVTSKIERGIKIKNTDIIPKENGNIRSIMFEDEHEGNMFNVSYETETHRNSRDNVFIHINSCNAIMRVSSRDRIVKELNAASNRIQRWLKIYFPEYTEVYKKFDSESGATKKKQLEVITETTTEAVLTMDNAENCFQ